MNGNMIAVLFSILAICLPGAGETYAAGANNRTVIYEGIVKEVGPSPASLATDQLWVTLADLKRATGFVVKPQGVCRDELCFPLPKRRRAEFLTRVGRTNWFNLTQFSRMLKQPVAHDSEHGVWYFGPRPEVQNSYLKTFVAPDFTLPDAQGKPHSLSDFRGKKVLLLTWASW